MRQVIIASLILLVMSPALASEEGFMEAYTAYQEVAVEGDLHAALPHAQRAYELGLELFGAEDVNTGMLAFNLGYIQSELLDYEGAILTLEVGLAALTHALGADAPDLFDTFLELGRAQLGCYHTDAAEETLARALAIAEAAFGPESYQAGQAHYLLAYIPLFAEPEGSRPTFNSTGIYLDQISLFIAERGWLPYYIRRGLRRDFGGPSEPLLELSPDHPAGEAHLEMAMSIFHGDPDRVIELASANLVEAAYDLDAGGGDEVDNLYKELLDELISIRYADDFLLRLALPWINARHRRGWSRSDIAENISKVAHFSNMRREGEVFSLMRIPPVYPQTAARVGQEGVVCLVFTVNAEGRTQDIEVYDSDNRRLLERSAQRAIESFLYAPRIQNGIPVSREDVRTCIDYQLAR